jgi:hypothetical protein
LEESANAKPNVPRRSRPFQVTTPHVQPTTTLAAVMQTTSIMALLHIPPDPLSRQPRMIVFSFISQQRKINEEIKLSSLRQLHAPTNQQSRVRLEFPCGPYRAAIFGQP